MLCNSYQVTIGVCQMTMYSMYVNIYSIEKGFSNR
jgi:hypothetical protein